MDKTDRLISSFERLTKLVRHAQYEIHQLVVDELDNPKEVKIQREIVNNAIRDVMLYGKVVCIAERMGGD